MPSDLGSTVFVAVCCVLTLMLSALGFALLYKFYLRRRLVQKMLKKD
jgi:ammonia channel protein AmtB